MSALLLSMFFVGFVLSALALWASAIGRVTSGRPILERDSHRPAVWGFVDILVTVVGLIGLQLVAGGVLHSSGLLTQGAERSLDDYFLTLMITAGCSIGAFLLSWLWIALRTGASPRDLGFRTDRLGRDLLIGVAAFIMLAPLVFTVQAIFVLIMGPTQHPLILLLQKTPDMRLFLAAGLNAVVVAPVVEEYFFRGLWQGWTESFRLPLSGEELLLGRRADSLAGAANAETSVNTQATPPVDVTNPYMATLVVEEHYADAPALGDSQRTVWWPILVSSLLFALAHFGHGPDGAALFVLAVGLGYVYQRTRSLLPSIVVHFLLNATSMAMLWVQLYMKP